MVRFNYDQQFLSSLQSLLDNLSEKLIAMLFTKSRITKYADEQNKFEHQNLYNLEIYKFNEDIKKFPNLEDNHISEARFFIDNYLDTSIENIIYLDFDIICLNSPEKILYELITKTQTSEYTIAASTEYIKSRETKKFLID